MVQNQTREDCVAMRSKGDNREVCIQLPITRKLIPLSVPQSGLASTEINRRDPTDRDVQIEILFCGICHSDLHSVRNEWSEFMATNYPIVPGHEIVGRVTKVASAVTEYKPGDLVAVG